jgi:hypothetical protein
MNQVSAKTVNLGNWAKQQKLVTTSLGTPCNLIKLSN